MRAITSTLLLALMGSAVADVYMHNPRGSNDRNCERNENRNNGNRLFDSQNNDKGGYACPRAVAGNNPEDQTPRFYYYAGSELPIEWTNQHGCGANEKVQCQVVVQYMCNWDAGTGSTGNPALRDGTPENINDAATDRMNSDQVNDQRYGYHETVEYYDKCEERRRNKGLWIADQDVAENGDATRTRQNPNGARRGWECPEERDYYPYWHPAPFKDIAILTDDLSQCAMFQAESQNVKPRGECMTADNEPAQENNPVECTGAGNNWVVTPAWGIPPPECQIAPWTRDNHLGSTAGGFASTYNWTIPEENAEACTLRLRYNISSSEVDWNLNSDYNDNNSPIQQDPYVDIGLGYKVSLAANTNQIGRTFQDRSYVFSIRPAPAEAAGKKIYNLNVRGKRGNIVQTYPAVEYDFVPNYLTAGTQDFVHFQWTGSDYNPNRNPNNAEGGPEDPANANNYRADRSNIVPVEVGKHVPLTGVQSFDMFDDQAMYVKLAYIDQNLGDCKDNDELLAQNNNNQNDADRDDDNCMKLNTARTPYFDAGLVSLKNPGTYTYMSTRNNNFTNRSQKGVIYVRQGSSANGGFNSGDSALGSDAATYSVALGVGVAAVGAAGAGAYVWAKKNPGSSLARALGSSPLLR